MKAFPWILAAGALGAAAYVVMNTPAPKAATGSDEVEAAARNVAEWGSNQRLRGAGGKFAGKVKESVGNVMGSGKLADQGIDQQVAGKVKKAAGKIAQAAGQTLHDLNR